MSNLPPLDFKDPKFKVFAYDFINSNQHKQRFAYDSVRNLRWDLSTRIFSGEEMSRLILVRALEDRAQSIFEEKLVEGGCAFEWNSDEMENLCWTEAVSLLSNEIGMEIPTTLKV